MELFSQLCVGKTITVSNIWLLKKVRNRDDAEITRLLLALFSTEKQTLTFRMGSAMQLIPLLEGYESTSLRVDLSIYLVDLVTTSIQRLQDDLRAQLMSSELGSIDDADLRLHTLGQALANSWILQN